MSRTRILIGTLVVLVILVLAVAFYVLQYRNLDVGVDESRSTVMVKGPSEFELVIVLHLINDGSISLSVPPTTFDVWADGVFVGPGKSEAVRVPAGGEAWSTARVRVTTVSAPLAYAALSDSGKDTIRLKGDAHVDLGPFTLDVPFDETFTVDA